MNLKQIFDIFKLSKEKMNVSSSHSKIKNISELYQDYIKGQIDINEKRFNDPNDPSQKVTLFQYLVLKNTNNEELSSEHKLFIEQLMMDSQLDNNILYKDTQNIYYTNFDLLVNPTLAVNFLNTFSNVSNNMSLLSILLKKSPFPIHPDSMTYYTSYIPRKLSASVLNKHRDTFMNDTNTRMFKNYFFKQYGIKTNIPDFIKSLKSTTYDINRFLRYHTGLSTPEHYLEFYQDGKLITNIDNLTTLIKNDIKYTHSPIEVDGTETSIFQYAITQGSKGDTLMMLCLNAGVKPSSMDINSFVDTGNPNKVIFNMMVNNFSNTDQKSETISMN